MTRSQHIAHIVVAVLAAVAGVVVELLTTSPAAHAAWVPLVLALAKYLVTAAGSAVPPGYAVFALFAFLGLGLTSCAHFPPGVNAPMCALDVIGDIGSVLVCDLADHTPLPACVKAGLWKIGIDHNCDVTGIVQAVGGNAQRNAEASGDYLEAVKAARARAWLAAQPPNPADVPPLHDKKK